MLQGISTFASIQSGMGHLGKDMQTRHVALRLFERQFSAAQRKHLLSIVMRRSRHLESLDEPLPPNGHYAGVQSVKLESIRGTENRGDEFDSDFLPLQEHVEQRWVSVASALLQNIPMPPIELLRVGDKYFVRDGHHRISVARALGYTMLEAVVTDYAA